MSDTLDVIEYLAAKGYHGKKTSNRDEFTFPCFFGCAEPPHSKKKKLYINSSTGMYHCKVCEERGGTTLLMRHFGDEPEGSHESAPVQSGKRIDILEGATAIGQQMLLNNDEMLLYLFNKRGLSEQTVLERRLGYVGGGWSLAEDARLLAEASRDDMLSTGLVFRDGPKAGQDFFYNHLLIPYSDQDRIVQMRGRVMTGQASGRYMTGPGEHVRLFGVDDLAADEILLTEGEFDAIIAAQYFRSSPDDAVRRIGVVGVPGVSSLPQGFESMFDHARRVYVGFDTDDPGKRGAVKVKELLGPKARIVELPDPNEGEKKNDWTHYFVDQGHTWQEAHALLGQASGRRIFSIGETGTAWKNERSAAPGLRTGYVGFDETIEPGLRPGQVMVVLAKTGTGKTVFLCNLAYNMRQRPTLFISLEQTKEEVYERLRRVTLFYEPRLSEAEIAERLSKLFICDVNRVSEKEFAELVEEFEIEVGVKPDVVLVDYLGYYAKGFKGGSAYERVSDAAMQLKAEAKKHRLVVIAPHQVNRSVRPGEPISIDDARDSGVIEETSDFLVSIWRADEASQDQMTEPSGKLRLSILKSRHGGAGRAFTMQMDLLTLALVDDHTPAAKQAAHNSYLYWRGTTHDDLRREQTKPVQIPMSEVSA